MHCRVRESACRSAMYATRAAAERCALHRSGWQGLGRLIGTRERAGGRAFGRAAECDSHSPVDEQTRKATHTALRLSLDIWHLFGGSARLLLAQMHGHGGRRAIAPRRSHNRNCPFPLLFPLPTPGWRASVPRTRTPPPAGPRNTPGATSAAAAKPYPV